MNITYRYYIQKDEPSTKLLDKESSVGQLNKYSQSDRNPFNNIQEYFFDNGGKFWVAVDTDNKKIVGTIGLKVLSLTEGKMKALRVHPAYRRHGIAKNLVAILEKYCLDNNFTKITLGVGADPDSVPAVKLYEKLGYKFLYEKSFDDGDKALYYEKELTQKSHRIYRLNF
jgi:ribosomal protein S18 acetylase RimI-like enzyme